MRGRTDSYAGYRTAVFTVFTKRWLLCSADTDNICITYPIYHADFGGLLRTPASAASIVSGTVMFYFLKGIKENEAVLSAVEEDSNAASKMVVAINQLLGNKEMYLVLATFIVILLVVYVVRRLSIDYAWTVASLAGILIGLTVLISGFVMLGIKGQIVWIIVGGVISTVIALIQQFLFFNLDYSRTERVQFEDDEYYYYVKAVPKIYVTTKEKRVKRIAAKDEEKRTYFPQMHWQRKWI